MSEPDFLARLVELEQKATPGPWSIESCGEKGDGSDMIGVAFGPDDQDCERPLAGKLPQFDRDGDEIEYYRDELVAECCHHNRNSSADAAFIAEIRNAFPEIVRRMALADRVVEAVRRVRRSDALPLPSRRVLDEVMNDYDLTYEQETRK